MVTKSQKVRLGIFVSVMIILLIILSISVIGTQIFQKRKYFFIKYKDSSINGLQVGGTVKYHGINVGRIDDISIDPENVSNIIIKFSVDPKTPIKSDVKAQLIYVGITGLKQVELVGGSNQSKDLPPNSFIMPQNTALTNISGKAEVIAEKVELLLNNLNSLVNVQNRENITYSIANFTDLLDSNRDNISSIVTNVDSITFYTKNITRDASKTMAKINNIINSKQLETILNNSSDFSKQLASIKLDSLVTNLQATIFQANRLVTHADLTLLKSRQDILRTFETLRETVDYLNEFAREINDDPRLLLREAQRNTKN